MAGGLEEEKNIHSSLALLAMRHARTLGEAFIAHAPLRCAKGVFHGQLAPSIHLNLKQHIDNKDIFYPGTVHA
ncbi:hypothetical protein AGMMS49543_13010 [Betaproteobacteria bacterium]|nr:hypothetical protein AGMMS49543_13010 [Betaproteobacteria bacterium]